MAVGYGSFCRNTAIRIGTGAHTSPVAIVAAIVAATQFAVFPVPAHSASPHRVKSAQGVEPTPRADDTGAQAAEAAEAADAADAADAARRAVDRMFSEPLAGVVVNRTVTVLGKDFYQFFATRWRHNSDSARYSISIHERPTARFGSEIWVQYRQQRMFHTFLPPARAASREISEVAVQVVLDNISRRELERLTTRNPDMGPEEL